MPQKQMQKGTSYLKKINKMALGTMSLSNKRDGRTIIPVKRLSQIKVRAASSLPFALPC